MKIFLTFVLLCVLCVSCVFAIADDEPPAAREILRGANEAWAARTGASQDYPAAIASVEKEMAARDLKTRAFLLGLYYEAWCEMRNVKCMEKDSVRFYNKFRELQFALQLSDGQLAKLAHHHKPSEFVRDR